MKQLLASITTNRFKGVFAGAFTTAVIQSSSVTTVLAVGFVAAGLLSLQQSIGIIMGAEIGTTITAQIIAFKVTKYALIPVIVGFVMLFFFGDKKVKRYGMMTLGIGLVFFGMNLMGDATRPLRSYQPFIDLLQQMNNPLLAVILSASFTALVQSSSATTGIIIVLASQGLITLEQGIALIFGANIGTSITAVLASIGKPREAVRTALVHVSFNVLGVTLWFNFIDQVAELIRWFSPVAATGLAGIEKLAAETPRQIANAHTLFNVGNTFIFIWFAGAFAVLVTKLVPHRPAAAEQTCKPKYLNDKLLETPSLAFDAVKLEISRLAERVLPMVREAPIAVMQGEESDLQRIREMDDDVDALHRAIIRYLGELSQQDITAQESEMLHDYIAVASYFEDVGDTIETNLVHEGMERIRNHVEVSEQTRKVIGELADKVYWAVEQATQAVVHCDLGCAKKAVNAKMEVDRLAENAQDHLFGRLTIEAPHRLSTYRMESELIENLKRIYYFTKHIGKTLSEIDTQSLAKEEDRSRGFETA
ncbi:MAG: Na/Pi cotransporter family protein [Pseudomonadota bacterium]